MCIPCCKGIEALSCLREKLAFWLCRPAHLLPRDVPDGKDKEKKTNRIGEKAMQAEGTAFPQSAKCLEKSSNLSGLSLFDLVFHVVF